MRRGESGPNSIMRAVTVYSRAFCGHCTRAVALLSKKGASVTVIDATFDPHVRDEMIARGCCPTFPQIFIGETHVGGCEDLQRLEASGGLDGLLEDA
jgi:glutaredoxin 3